MRFLALFAALLWLLGFAAPDPAAVLKAIVDNERGGNMRGILTLVATRPDRETRYVLEVISDGKDRGLIRVMAPAREAGQSFLTVGENLWIYNPRLKRSLRLPPSGRSDSFLGSDIAYNDLSGRDTEKDYSAKVTAEDAGSLTLELTPKPDAPTPYGKLVFKAKVPGYAPLEVLYYDQRNQAVRRIVFSDHTKVGERFFPTKIVVEDLLKAGYKTSVQYSNYRVDVAIPERCFGLDALENGCP